ncbi:MAG: DUF5667 domain-containing protein [Candidatus Spechtbacterales bacterium]
MKKLLVFTVVLGLALSVVGASAHVEGFPEAGITPDSFWFFLDQWGEGMATFFAFSNDAKAQKYLERAEERLSEAHELEDRNTRMSREMGAKDVAGFIKAMELYQQHFAAAVERAQNASENVQARVAEATLKHMEVLEDVLGHVPEQAHSAIERAMVSSQQGQEAALEALSEQNSSRAEEVRQNINMMGDVPDNNPVDLP